MRYLISTLISLCIISCSSVGNEQRNIVSQMSKIKITFPKDLTYQIGATEIGFDPSAAEYKILVYIDSNDCSICKMRLSAWNEIISRFKV